VWHTGVVAFGSEWYFGNDGISCCPPKGTVLGQPNEILKLGRTEINENDFLEIVRQMSESSFKIGSYNLLEHNCNNFSDELAKVLVGKPIPQHILDLPREILNTTLGPMLRPLLEQAADPVHQLGSGQTPLFSKLASNMASNSAANGSKADANEALPSTAIVYKPKLDNKIDDLAKLFVGEKSLLNEIKDYLQQAEITWSISNAHIALLFDLFLSKTETKDQKLAVLQIFQLIALKSDAAKLIISSPLFVENFLPQIKASKDSDIQYSSLQMLSNMCTHTSICRALLEKKIQECIIKNLSDFTLIDARTDPEQLVHESSLSFFYNYVSVFHLESLLDESQALVLGVALLERMPKANCKPKSVYHMLALLRSCLSKSGDIRDLAHSLNFDSNFYNTKEADGDSILNNINELIHSNDEN
jgi:hypothetical protein